MGRKYLITVLCVLISVPIIAQHAPALEFTENKGQWVNQVKFRGQLNSGAFYLQNKGFTVVLHNEQDLKNMMDPLHRPSQITRTPFDNGKQVDDRKRDGRVIRSHAYNVWFKGASDNVTIVPEKAAEGLSNYFIGNDRSKWASNVRSYFALLYKNVYPGIDVRYYSESGKLKYDLIVNPGGNVDDVELQYEGVNGISIRNKELVIKTSVGEVRELYPYSFEFSKTAGRRDVECSYVLGENNTVRFRVRNHTPGSTLVIDPTVVFSSFTGSRADQYGFTATPGPDGSLYSGGIVFGDSGNPFPTTPGAYMVDYQGGKVDIGIMKFSSNGSSRVYATYIGGNQADYPHSLFCDPQGNLVVMGRSYSGTDYPGQVLGGGGGADIVVTKLNATGSGIIGSLVIGGSADDGVNIFDMQAQGSASPKSLMQNYGDDSRSEVILDRANNIYIAAQTKSANFPGSNNGFGTQLSGKQDGIVIKIDPSCNNIIWSNYLGGAEDDGAFVLAINPGNQNIYVAGATSSQNDFPGNKSGTIHPTFRGGMSDGFVSILSNDGSTLLKTTFLGTPALDIIYGIQFDRLGFPYVMGITRGTWPTTTNVGFINPNTKQFVAKLRTDLSAFVYSTTFGSSTSKPNMSPVAFLVDRCENIYISGWGGWIDPGSQDPFDLAGVAGMPISADAVKRNTDNKDFYFIVIQKNAAALLYGTFFGQDNGEGEHVDGGTSRFDEQGVIYQAMCANCAGGATFPTTPGVVGPVNGALPSGCNLAAVKIAFNFAGVASGPKAYYNNVPDSSGCAPFTVTLRDTVLNAKSYEWSFDDGSPTVITDQFEITHTFQNVGNYLVRLIAVDSNTCNIRDTQFIRIRVTDNIATLGFNAVKQAPCESLTYRFDNTSTGSGVPFGAQSFIWDFGDGRREPSGFGSMTHTFAAPGTYNVRLILVDTNYCNSPDSITQTVRVAPLVDARFEIPGTGCAPFTANFLNTSLAGQSFFWDFGDGSTSTEANPTHLYPNPGSYRVRLIAVDPATCNVRDTTEMVFNVAGIPTADFTHAPIPPEVNKPTVFTNLSTGGVSYKWLFGDGDSTVKTTLDTAIHQYVATGVYNACLITYNAAGCTDTICKTVEARVEPGLDIPNAFTPGKFGNNSVIRVAGFGIAKMTWRIYNRWGQKVFESTDPRYGWDGMYKGAIQPVDVYAYTLDVEFFDGVKVRRTGDITLLK